MGFWDTVGKVGKGVVDHVNERSQQIQAHKARLSPQSDEKLMEIAKSTSAWVSSDEKFAANQLLKERRGY